MSSSTLTLIALLSSWVLRCGLLLCSWRRWTCKLVAFLKTTTLLFPPELPSEDESGGHSLISALARPISADALETSTPALQNLDVNTKKCSRTVTISSQAATRSVPRLRCHRLRNLGRMSAASTNGDSMSATRTDGWRCYEVLDFVGMV